MDDFDSWKSIIQEFELKPLTMEKFGLDAPDLQSYVDAAVIPNFTYVPKIIIENEFVLKNNSDVNNSCDRLFSNASTDPLDRVSSSQMILSSDFVDVNPQTEMPDSIQGEPNDKSPQLGELSPLPKLNDISDPVDIENENWSLLTMSNHANKFTSRIVDVKPQEEEKFNCHEDGADISLSMGKNPMTILFQNRKMKRKNEASYNISNGLSMANSNSVVFDKNLVSSDMILKSSQISNFADGTLDLELNQSILPSEIEIQSDLIIPSET